MIDIIITQNMALTETELIKNSTKSYFFLSVSRDYECSTEIVSEYNYEAFFFILTIIQSYEVNQKSLLFNSRNTL
jgi:hypothetical protein